MNGPAGLPVVLVLKLKNESFSVLKEDWCQHSD